MATCGDCELYNTQDCPLNDQPVFSTEEECILRLKWRLSDESLQRRIDELQEELALWKRATINASDLAKRR